MRWVCRWPNRHKLSSPHVRAPWTHCLSTPSRFIHSNFRELSTSTVSTVGLLISCLLSLFHHYIRSRRVLYYPNQSDWCCYYNCSVQNQRCCGRNGWFVHLIWMVRKRPKIFTSIFVKSCIFNVHRVGWSWSFRGFRSFCEDSKTVGCIYTVTSSTPLYFQLNRQTADRRYHTDSTVQ
jgi:hypothetical protein